MNAERELRDLVDERVRAVRARDSATLAARPTDDVITFDVLPPLNSRGSQATVEHLQEWVRRLRRPHRLLRARRAGQRSGRSRILLVPLPRRRHAQDR
jgi:ketosteroid isomerase-like protein